jgi:hypothetical protein
MFFVDVPLHLNWLSFFRFRALVVTLVIANLLELYFLLNYSFSNALIIIQNICKVVLLLLLLLFPQLLLVYSLKLGRVATAAG